MDQNILTRQMQNQYVQQLERKAHGLDRLDKVRAFWPTLFMTLVTLIIPLGSILAGLIYLGIRWDFGIALICTVPGVLVGMGVFMLGYELMDSFHGKRKKKAGNIIQAAKKERESWWNQVGELLEKSERGTLNDHSNYLDAWEPTREWLLPDETTRSLRAVKKNGAVWLVDDDNGDVLVRTYGDRGMTTVITDEGDLVAVSASAAALMGEKESHPDVQ